MVLIKALGSDGDLLSYTFCFYFILRRLWLSCSSPQDNRISLVDYVVSYYLHNVDKVLVKKKYEAKLFQVDYLCLFPFGKLYFESKEKFNFWVPDVIVVAFLNCIPQNGGTDKSIFPLPEPQDVFLAAQVKFDDLIRDLRQLGRDLTSKWRHQPSFIPAPSLNPKKYSLSLG